MQDRAQSELVGTILLVSLVVLSVSVGGSFAIASLFGEQTPSPTVDTAVELTPSNFTVVHRGGDPLDVSDLNIVVSRNGSSTTYALESGRVNGVAVSSTTVLVAGDRWTPPGPDPFGPSDEVRVVVVHEPSGTVLVTKQRSADSA
ncbi:MULTISPECIES: type IV pilin [Haloferax]|uniref:Type IV pilin n=2 Tax=Haloferax TaxID=2251 RepID=A0A6G1Z1L6_9EURY|nr:MULTISPECIES: type IV pilin [Haloferax]KAB1187751.1 type IV pilin [Haloferax sp. CBA1149]MRW80412.1 type IV pilin [Haloferax marinisediminis]